MVNSRRIPGASLTTLGKNFLHPTQSYWDALEDICAPLGDAEDEFLEALDNAIRKLEDYRWDGSLHIEPYGHTGSEFSLVIDEEFRLVFIRETYRADEGKTIKSIHLTLIDIEPVP